jgi:predicted nucleic acid-binding protein
LLDDLRARKIAEARGIKIIGVLGILILAKEKKLIYKVKPLLDEIIRLDFRISKPLYEYVLIFSGEK